MTKGNPFYEFDSGDEMCSTTDMESEVMKFLRSAKSLDALTGSPRLNDCL